MKIIFGFMVLCFIFPSISEARITQDQMNKAIGDARLAIYEERKTALSSCRSEKDQDLLNKYLNNVYEYYRCRVEVVQARVDENGSSANCPVDWHYKDRDQNGKTRVDLRKVTAAMRSCRDVQIERSGGAVTKLEDMLYRYENQFFEDEGDTAEDTAADTRPDPEDFRPSADPADHPPHGVEQ